MTMKATLFLETAIRAAGAAAALHLRHFGRNVRIDKRCGKDLKLGLDRESEAVVMDVIRSRFPDHMIFSEETGYHRAPGDYLWIIDPLDGSVNYFHGLHYYCCSIACFHKPVSTDPGDWATLDDMGTPVAAVVSAPALGETFTVAADQGARRNGNALQLAEGTDVRDAVVGVSFGSSEEIMHDMFGRVHGVARDARKIRCLGSTALGVAYVASGQFNAYVQRHIHAWDIAAACMMAKGAGGFVKAERDGPDQWKVVACNPGLVAYFENVL
jgi:myo-inositol-1(or 4)-monophosphatase